MRSFLHMQSDSVAWMIGNESAGEKPEARAALRKSTLTIGVNDSVIGRDHGGNMFGANIPLLF